MSDMPNAGLNAAPTNAPKGTTPINKYGLLIAVLGFFLAAIVLVLGFLAMRPAMADSFFQRGKVSPTENMAITNYTWAILMNPNYTAAYMARGKAYDVNLNPAPAIADFTVVIQNSDDIAAWIERGLAYLSMNDHNNAMHDFNTAIPRILNGDIDSTRSQYGEIVADDAYLPFYERARLLFGQGGTENLQRAIGDLNEAIRRRPYDFPSLTLRAQLNEQIGNDSMAIADLEVASQSASSTSMYNYVDVFESLGQLYQKTGDTQKALTNYSIAIVFNRSYPILYLNRGMYYRLLGQNELAQADFVNFVKTSQSGSDARLILAKQGITVQ